MLSTTFHTFERQSSASVYAGESHHAIAPLLNLALGETNSQGAYLYHFDPATRSARTVAWNGLSPVSRGTAPETPGAIIGVHLGRQAPIILHDAAWSDPRFEALSEFRKNRFEGVVSIPLLDAAEVVGMLDVCRTRRAVVHPREFAFLLGLSVPIGALLATVAAKSNLERELEKLTRQLADRGVMERAKGLIQARFGWTEEQAYFSIRNVSRRRRLPMREIAREVIDGTLHIVNREAPGEA